MCPRFRIGLSENASVSIEYSTGKLLVATPRTIGDVFGRSVVLVLQHEDDAAPEDVPDRARCRDKQLAGGVLDAHTRILAQADPKTWAQGAGPSLIERPRCCAISDKPAPCREPDRQREGPTGSCRSDLPPVQIGLVARAT